MLALNEIYWPDGDMGLIARGVVDEDTVPFFERRLVYAVSTTPRNVIIDVTECELAAAGLAALRHLNARDSERASNAVLVASRSHTLRTLHIVGLASRHQIYPTLGAARIALHAHPATAARTATPAAMVEQTEPLRGAEQTAQVAVAPFGEPDRYRAARPLAGGADSGLWGRNYG